MLISGGVAQLGERRLCKPEVIGSIPFASTNIECEAFDGKFRTHRSTPRGRKVPAKPTRARHHRNTDIR